MKKQKKKRKKKKKKKKKKAEQACFICELRGRGAGSERTLYIYSVLPLGTAMICSQLGEWGGGGGGADGWRRGVCRGGWGGGGSLGFC